MKQIFGLLTFVLMAQTILSQTQPTNNTSWSTTKKIGIGATAPFYWLDVNAPASFAGTHADSPNLNYLPNTGKLLIVRNHNGAGEIVFLGNRGSGSVGGFNFYDYPNSGSTIKNLLSVDGAGHLSIGAISGYTNTNTSLNSGIANFRIYSLSQPLAQISSPNGDLNMSLNSTN